MDIIFIRQLKIPTRIGIYDWERQIKQTIILHLELGFDSQKAAKTDSIDDTLDYKTISKELQQWVAESQFFLLETLANKIAEWLQANFSIRWLRLTINKGGALRGAKEVGLIIERGEKF